MANLLEQLTKMTVVVADTGDFKSIEKFLPRDATTNPSLITAAAQMPEYAELVTEAVRWAHAQGGTREQQVTNALEGNPDRLSDVMIAYEPVWAIGSANPAPADYINTVICTMRAHLAERFSRPTGSIIYGGSAGPGMLAELPEADGLFLGRFAHDPTALGAVIAEARELSK